MPYRVLIAVIVFLFASFHAQAQEDITHKLKRQLDGKLYDSVITEANANPEGYSAEDFFYTGMAYYDKNDDDNCIVYMSKALAMDPDMAAAHYYRAMSRTYIEQYLQAIEDFQHAIALDTANSEYCNSLGELYYKVEDYDDALKILSKAIHKKNPAQEAYTMIAQVYVAKKEPDKALAACYFAKAKLPVNSPPYNVALFNIGQLEILNAHYDQAEAALKEYHNDLPRDYTVYPKLMQVFYGKKMYDSAKPMRDTLYYAYRKGRLRKTLDDRFCYDQFTWKDKHIEAYEKFEVPRYNGDTKLLFYVLNSDNSIMMKIQTEYDPILVELGTEMKYVLCKEQSEIHETYSSQYGDTINYPDLKQAVLDVLDGKLKPVSEGH